jgi:hypothetical protein
VEVWRYLQAELGGFPTVDELDTVLEVFKEYRGGSRPNVSGPTSKGGKSSMGRVFDRPIFTPAYLVFPQSAVPGTDKVDSIIELTKRLFGEYSPTSAVRAFSEASSQAERFAALRKNKGVADFMSMQILTDWGYVNPGPADLEDQFVIAGPGAIKGAKELDSKRSPSGVIEWAASAIRILEDCPKLPGGKQPSYMDVQNCLCEFSKYVRYQGKPDAKPYKPAHPGPQPAPVLPQHW